MDNTNPSVIQTAIDNDNVLTPQQMAIASQNDMESPKQDEENERIKRVVIRAEHGLGPTAST